MTPSVEHVSISELTGRFLEQGTYLRNWSPKTRHLYGRIFKRFTPDDLSKPSPTDTDISRLLTFRPKGVNPRRAWTLMRCCRYRSSHL